MNNLIELAADLARITPRVKAQPETMLERGPYKLKRLEGIFYIIEGRTLLHTEREEWRAREFFHGLKGTTV